MTKQLKKGLLTVLLFVMAVCCAFSVNSFATVKADNTAFQDALAVYKTAAGITGEVTETAVLAARDNNSADVAFVNLRTQATTAGDSLTEEESRIYKAIADVYNEDGVVDLYANLVTLNVKTYAEHHELVETLRQQYTAVAADVDAYQYKFLINTMNGVYDLVTEGSNTYLTPELLIKAEDKIESLQAKIKAAIDAVRDIDVTTNNVSTVNVHDGTDFITGYTFVSESSESIANARTLYNGLKVGNNISEQAYLNGTLALDGDYIAYDYLSIIIAGETAVADYNAQIANAKAYIEHVYAQFKVGTEIVKCYSIRNTSVANADGKYNGGINGANATYTALNGYTFATDDEELNNLYKVVRDEVGDKMKEMLDTLAADTDAIEDVVDLITAIGTPAYTKAVKEATETARTSRDDLRSDILDSDISNYDALTNAESQWITYEGQIRAAFTAFDNVLTALPDERFVKMSNAITLANNLSLEQKTADNGNLTLGFTAKAFDEEVNFEDETFDTYGALYQYVNLRVNEINTATAPIVTAIENLGAIALTDTFDANIKNIIDAINYLKGTEEELNPLYIGAITQDRYNAFNTKVANYNELLGFVNEWADAVEVVGVVCTDKFDAIQTAVDEFDEIAADYYGGDRVAELASFAREYNDKAYASYYSTYVAFNAKKAEIIDHMDKLKIMTDGIMASYLPGAGEDDYWLDLFLKVTQENFEAMREKFVPACENAGAIYNYFIDNYTESFEDYKYILAVAAAQDIEIAIAAIADDVAIDNISAARAAYEAAEGYTFVIPGVDVDAKPLYSLELYSADDVEAAVDNLNVLTTAEGIVQGFITDVYDLLDGAALDGSDVDADDIDENALIEKDEDLEGFYKLNLTTVDTLKNRYVQLPDVYKAYSYEVDGETLSVEGAYNFLLKLVKIAGTENTSKIGYIDQMINSYLDKYYNEDPAIKPEVGEYEKIKSLTDALHETQHSLLSRYSGDKSFAGLGQDKLMAEQLVAAIVKLNSTVDVTEDTVANYHVVRAIYESLSASQKGLVNVSSLGYASTEAALDAIKVKLDKAEIISIKDLQAAVDALGGADEQLKAEFNKLNNQIDAVKKFAEELKNNSATKEEMKAAYKELYNKILGVDEYFGKLVAEVEKTLKNSIEIVDAKAVKNADDIKVIFADIEAIEKLIGVVPEGSTVVAEIAAAKAAAIAKAEELVAALNDKLYKAEEGDIVKINAELVDINATIAALDSTYATDADVAAKLAALKTELETAIANAIKAEADARIAADEALKADLKAAVEKLNKTITIITIILAVVSVACAGAIVYIFLKKRA